MDERLEKALEFSKYMSTLSNQRRLLHEKYLENSIHYLNGGKFTVDKELINFCNMMVISNQDSVVLIDDNHMPIEVADIRKFLEDILNIYFTNTQEYFVEFNKLKSNRTVEGMLWVKVFCYLLITMHRLIMLNKQFTVQSV